MLILSLSGRTILETTHKTLKQALEHAAAENIDVSGADLRRAKLCDAALDGLIASQASFWGADLKGADIGFADLSRADLRCADLSDACFAESDLTGADARGAYFSQTIFEQTVLDEVRVSCPSIWGCDLAAAESMRGMVYAHAGESEIRLSLPPLVVDGLEKRLVVLGDDSLWGNTLYRAGHMPKDLQQALFVLKMTGEKLLSRNAKTPMPKIQTKGQLI